MNWNGQIENDVPVSVPASAGAANGAVLPVKAMVVATPNVKTVISVWRETKEEESNRCQMSMPWRAELRILYIYTWWASVIGSSELFKWKMFRVRQPSAIRHCVRIWTVLTSLVITGKQEKVLEKKRWDRSVTTTKRVTASCWLILNRFFCILSVFKTKRKNTNWHFLETIQCILKTSRH